MKVFNLGSRRSLLPITVALVIAAGALAVWALSASEVRGATLTVTNTGDSGAGSLRQAIADANSGDTIDFAVTGTITLTTGQLVISQDLTIEGPGTGSLTISGNNVSRVFSITVGNVAISGVTIRDGNSGSDSGGIQNFGTLTLTNSTVSGNTANDNGGGIFSAGGTLTITNSTVSGNSGEGGGIHNGGGTLTITNSTVSDNIAGDKGGGIRNDGTLTITNSTVSDNNDGGIRNDGTLTITNSTVSDNNGDKGGGIHNGGSGILTITNSTVSDNQASDDGGGIFNAGGALTITNSTVSGNTADDGGASRLAMGRC